MSGLQDGDRIVVEDIICDMQQAAERYLDTQKGVHLNLLEISVNEGLEILQTLKKEIKEDKMSENYKLHMFVPIQILKIIEEKKRVTND